MKTILRLFPLILGFALITSCALPSAVMQLDNYENEHYVISQQIDEISGLEWDGKYFYGFNDSGGKPEIYTFTKQAPASIHQTIKLANATNIDWEEMAVSDTFYFVGDTGNNLGNRRDLKVYYFPKDAIGTQRNVSVQVDTLQYFYPEQEDFSVRNMQHDFDMEAMVYHNNRVHLFTKEWQSSRTRHFHLDMVKGIQPAWMNEQYPIPFMVTGADIRHLRNKWSRLLLVGYTRTGEVYLLSSVFPTNQNKMFQHDVNIQQLGHAEQLGQVEGVTWISDTDFCISAERMNSQDGVIEQNIRCYKKK
ncbi:MAG: hypothetical protein Q4F57_08710 [Weeksellaceae bacterium]|nr:hypothetical protein [Weeksellaceae bacterium]